MNSYPPEHSPFGKDGRHPGKQAGFALLPVILSMIVIGGMIGAGLNLLGPKVKQAKYARTAQTLDTAVQSVVSWATANGRLPDYTEFPGILKETDDAWSNPVTYVYDNNLATLSSGGLCGRQSTRITAGSVPDTALILLSGGNDFTLDTLIPANGVVTFPTTVTVSNSDMGRTMTLAKLQNRAGCFGDTRGKLQILNNEMPAGVSPKATLPTCSGVSYNASVFAEGGVPSPISPFYSWTYTTPSWLALANPSDAQLDLQGNPTTPGVFTLVVTVSDSDGNSIQKTFSIDIDECVP